MTLSFNVTRRKLVLGTPDATTGWYTKSYTESTIEMIIFDRATSQFGLPAGTYIRLDAVGLTADPVEEGDQILTGPGVYYEVKGIKKHYLGDSFVRRDCDLERVLLYKEGA